VKILLLVVFEISPMQWQQDGQPEPQFGGLAGFVMHQQSRP